MADADGLQGDSILPSFVGLDNEARIRAPRCSSRRADKLDV